MTFEEEIASMVVAHNDRRNAEASAKAQFETAWKGLRTSVVTTVFEEARAGLGGPGRAVIAYENGWTELQLAGNSQRLRFHGDPSRQRIVCTATAGSPPEELFEAAVFDRAVVEAKTRDLVTAFLAALGEPLGT